MRPSNPRQIWFYFIKRSTHHFVCMYVLIKGGLHRYNIEYLWPNQFTTNENIDRFFVQGDEGGFYFIKGSTYSFVGQMLYMAGKTYFFTKDSSDIGWKLRIYEGSFVLPFKGLFLLFDILIRQSSWWNKNRSSLINLKCLGIYNRLWAIYVG